ncbi:MAG: DEAD/DEAH box helicase [Phycisphaerae bacterium]
MAEALGVEDLRNILRSEKKIVGRQFLILRSISALFNEGLEHESREMVLRALEHRRAFGELQQILDALTRSVGLFPYADSRNLDFRDSIALEFHRPLNSTENFYFHREQGEVYRRLLAGDSVILSAPTSFGKSRLIDAMISLRRFSNIAVIVPTLALIDETRRRLSRFSSTYKIITHLSQEPAAKNVFVFTAERAIAYRKFPKIDFFVIDEFYKIGALDEDTVRTVALNQAFYQLAKDGGQFYLLGPNIEKIPAGLESKYKCMFYPTNFSTVVVEQERVQGQGDEIEQLIALAKTLHDPTLVFCRSPARVNEVARAFLKAGIGGESKRLGAAADWIGRNFHREWVLPQGLMRGIGIHHGRLPRAIAQFVVRSFNSLHLRFLICTSTLIEGVNTKAKNVIIFDNSIAKKQIDFFTFNNIRGRSGRMFEHFVGKVFLFKEPPQEQLPFVDFPVFSQTERVPESLLIQIDPEDLKATAAKRMERFHSQDVVPFSVLQKNATMDPERQLNLARHIAADPQSLAPGLNWKRYPTYKQLAVTCKLIWDFLVEASRRHGVWSASQLAFKTFQVQKKIPVAQQVVAELKAGEFAAKNVDEAVERVLDFERSWAHFELPRYLSVVSSIQNIILGRAGIRAGDFSLYSSHLECLFRDPVVMALDEYGIPIQLGERLRFGTRDDLDIALAELKRATFDPSAFHPFELELLRDAQNAI